MCHPAVAHVRAFLIAETEPLGGNLPDLPVVALKVSVLPRLSGLDVCQGKESLSVEELAKDISRRTLLYSALGMARSGGQREVVPVAGIFIEAEAHEQIGNAPLHQSHRRATS